MLPACKNLIPGLFGARKAVTFHPQKSLCDNFEEMCRLPFHRSKETQQLRKLLKECQMHSTATPLHLLTGEERKKDIAILELTTMILDDWTLERQLAGLSANLIIDFHDQVKVSQKNLVKLDYQLFICENTIRARQPQTWKNPLFHRDHLKQYLSLEHQQLFYSLEQKLEEKNPNLNHPFTQFSYAIFMPIFNSFMDLDFVFDGFNTCLDLVKLC